MQQIHVGARFAGEHVFKGQMELRDGRNNKEGRHCWRPSLLLLLSLGFCAKRECLDG
jgi:hypothetical protein